MLSKSIFRGRSKCPPKPGPHRLLQSQLFVVKISSWICHLLNEWGRKGEKMLIFDQWHHWLAHNQSHIALLFPHQKTASFYQAFWNTIWVFFSCLIQCPGSWGKIKARRAPIHLHSSGEWDSNRDNKCYYLYYPLICTLSAAKTLQIFLTPSRTISTCFQTVNLLSDLHPRDYNKMWNNLNIESHFTENGNRYCREKHIPGLQIPSFM